MDELVEVARALSAGLHEEPARNLVRPSVGTSAAVAAVLAGGRGFGWTGAALMAIPAVLLLVASAARGRRPRVELTPEGIVVFGKRTTLLSYADVDSVQRTRRVVKVRAGDRTLRLVPRTPGLLAALSHFLDAQTERARSLAADRAAVTAFLERARATTEADYRHAAPPTSALEAIARAKSMPVRLRIDAARAVGLEPEALEIGGDLEQYADFADQALPPTAGRRSAPGDR